MIETTIGEARTHLDEAHHWARVRSSTPTVTSKSGGAPRTWNAREEARKHLIAARNRIDAALAALGGP